MVKFPEPESVKPGALTPRLTVVVTITSPEVPVIVSVVLPGAAEPLAVNVNKLVPVVGFGFQRAVTPLGNPETEKVTWPVKPYCGFTVTKVVPDVPWPMLRLWAESVKVGAYTLRDRVVVAV